MAFLVIPKISLAILETIPHKDRSVESTKIPNPFEHELFLLYISSVLYFVQVEKYEMQDFPRALINFILLVWLLVSSSFKTLIL